MHAVAVGDPRQPVPSHRQTSSTSASAIGLAVNVTMPSRGVDDGAHLQVVGRHRLPVDEETAGTVAVGDHHEALAEHGRRAGDQLDPASSSTV